MKYLQRHRRPVAALMGVLCAQTALAGTVTVNVTSRSGGAAADAVLVFDPLDAPTAPTAPPAPAAPAAPAAPGHATAIIDQVNKRFVPRVSVVRTGTTITFPNSDRIRHQVYSFSRAKTFTLKLYAGSPNTPVTFDQPGLVVLGCNIHDNMVAFVGVVDSPYFAKTGDSGTAALNLPAGRYRLRAWQANAIGAIPPQEITVPAAPLTIPLAIDVDSTSAIVAGWLE